MRVCEEHVTATARCGKMAVVTALPGYTLAMCSACALRVYERMKARQAQAAIKGRFSYDLPCS